MLIFSGYPDYNGMHPEQFPWQLADISFEDMDTYGPYIQVILSVPKMRCLAFFIIEVY